MASELIHKDLKVINLNRSEIVDIISLLSAQLGGVPLPGRVSGAVPEVYITEHGVVKYRLVLILEATCTCSPNANDYCPACEAKQGRDRGG